MLSDKIKCELRSIKDQTRRNFKEAKVGRCIHFIEDLLSNRHDLSPDDKREFWYPSIRVRDVKARPVFNISEFGDARFFHDIGIEIASEIRDSISRINPVFEANFDELSTDGVWRDFPIKSGRKWNSVSKTLLPITHANLKKISRIGEMCFVSKLAPESKIAPHCGPWNIRANLHLGISIPGDCGISVAGHTLKWAEDGWLAFDDSFEHYAWNNSAKERVVLVINVWHPDLSQAEISVFEAISDLIVRFEKEQI